MQSIREQRRDQMFPKLDPVEIERVRRFGGVRSFAAGDPSLSLDTDGQSRDIPASDAILLRVM
jgi:hypothetical protein